MKYTAIVNNEDTCKTNSFNVMNAFVESIEDVERIEIIYIEDDRELKLAYSGINCCHEFSESKICYRYGRTKGEG